MLVIPAIDLLGGACVRLRQGGYDSARRYAVDPVEAALGYARAGARWVHVVDLDAARGTGADARYPGGANRAVIRRLREALSHAGGQGGQPGAGPRCRLEVGGGIRTERDVGELAEAGADRLILGTVLVREPERVAAWVSARPRYSGVGWREAIGSAAGSAGPELWAGIDARDGRVRVAGWEQEAGVEDLELAARARDLGLGGIVYTSIARDGTLAGPDIERTNRLAEAGGLPVILSGGIGSEQDVGRVERERAEGVAGVIVGKALYEGRADFAELIRRYG